jgi:rhamnose utilization protein RhaD (predicted bifunctional aldolase and dehydrogenase)
MDISQLVTVSQFYGKQKEYTLGGGGNTSYKNDHHLYVKASGQPLATITENGFAVLDRALLKKMRSKKYSSDAQIREQEVKNDLLACRVDPSKDLRPSVETLLHDSIEYSFVVHTHPHLLNGLLCSDEAEHQTIKLFGNKALFVPYTDPGIVLSKIVSKYLNDYRKIHQVEPHYIFLQNHGVFVAANSVDEIMSLYLNIESRLLKVIPEKISITAKGLPKHTERDIHILKDYLPGNKYLAYRYNSLVQSFTNDLPALKNINKPFIPDQIVYCKAYPLTIQKDGKLPLKTGQVDRFYKDYVQYHGYDPKVILIENGPVIGMEENKKAAELVLDIFEDAMKISFYSRYFGGPHFMTPDQIEFIENWEAENYRRNISKK